MNPHIFVYDAKNLWQHLNDFIAFIKCEDDVN